MSIIYCRCYDVTDTTTTVSLKVAKKVPDKIHKNCDTLALKKHSGCVLNDTEQ